MKNTTKAAPPIVGVALGMPKTPTAAKEKTDPKRFVFDCFTCGHRLPEHLQEALRRIKRQPDGGQQA